MHQLISGLHATGARSQCVEQGELVLTWEPGQASALDTEQIAQGRDVGNVVVQRKSGAGMEDVPYDVTFAFVFHAFNPEGTWHLK